MADPTAPAPPQGAKGKRQKRLLYAAGAAVVLALVFLLQRGGGAPQEQAVDPTAEAVPSGAPPFGSTFADNGEAAGNLGTALTEGLAGVQVALEDQGGAFQDLSDQLNEQPPVSAETPATTPGGTGTNTAAGQAKKRRPLNPKSTNDHVAAGLRRVGRTGNLYRDQRGRAFHRVGKGKDAHFVPGRPKKKPPPKAHAAAAANQRPTTPPHGAARPPTAPPGVHGRHGGTNAAPKRRR